MANSTNVEKGTSVVRNKCRVDAGTSPRIPPEILQTIFRGLDFFDLLRCQLVCKAWRDAVSGDDPVLHAKLFLVAPFTEEEHHVPKLIIRLKVPVDVVRLIRQLPQLSFGIEVFFRDDAELMPDDFEPAVNFEDDTISHPIVEEIESYMHLVNPNFEESKHKGEACIFYFATLEHLKEQTQLPDCHDYDDGCWRNMLLCSPAVDELEVEFRWAMSPHRRSVSIHAPADQGVTVGQYVNAMREMLAFTCEDVQGFSGEMDTLCRNCEHDIQAEEWV